MKSITRKEVMRKLWSRTIVYDNGCWVWSGGWNKEVGYGYFSTKIAGKRWTVHRLSWVLHNGPIPSKLMVLHTCDNPPCWNPGHLFLGTARDNMQDAIEKGHRVGRPKKERN